MGRISKIVVAIEDLPGWFGLVSEWYVKEYPTHSPFFEANIEECLKVIT